MMLRRPRAAIDPLEGGYYETVKPVGTPAPSFGASNKLRSGSRRENIGVTGWGKGRGGRGRTQRLGALWERRHRLSEVCLKRGVRGRDQRGLEQRCGSLIPCLRCCARAKEDEWLVYTWWAWPRSLTSAMTISLGSRLRIWPHCFGGLRPYVHGIGDAHEARRRRGGNPCC